MALAYSAIKKKNLEEKITSLSGFSQKTAHELLTIVAEIEGAL
jgi:hypothetical protein